MGLDACQLAQSQSPHHLDSEAKNAVTEKRGALVQSFPISLLSRTSAYEKKYIAVLVITWQSYALVVVGNGAIAYPPKRCIFEKKMICHHKVFHPKGNSASEKKKPWHWKCKIYPMRCSWDVLFARLYVSCFTPYILMCRTLTWRIL